MAQYNFSSESFSALGFAGSGATPIVFDQLLKSFSWRGNLTDADLGIDLPAVELGATVSIAGKLGIVFTLVLDGGDFQVQYTLDDHADGFTEWVGEFATPYTTVGGEVLALYRNQAMTLRPDLDFVDGAMPYVGPQGPSSFRADFVYALSGTIERAYAAVDYYFDTYEVVGIDVGVPFLPSIDSKEKIFEVVTGQNIELPSWFPVKPESYLVVPGPATDYGAVTFDGDPIPGMTRDGTAPPFLNLIISMGEILSKLFPLYQIVYGRYDIDGDDTFIYWSLVDVELNIQLNVVQKAHFDMQGVHVAVDTEVNGAAHQHLEGALGDDFTLDTPVGQGQVDATVTYTPYGEYKVDFGLVATGKLTLKALEFGVHNTNWVDFDGKVGPLVNIPLPDADGWSTAPLWLFSNTLSVPLSSQQVTYSAFFQNDPEGTPGADTLQANDDQSLLNGRAGNDYLVGSYKSGIVFGNDGNDTVQGHGNGEVVAGGRGNDVVYGGVANDIPSQFLQGFNAAPVQDGNDILTGGSGDDTMYGGAGNDALYAGDVATHGNGADIMFGDAGNDTLYTGKDDGHADTLDGGDGNDLAVIDRSGYTGKLNFNGELGYIVLPDGTTLQRVEAFELRSGFGADTLTGGSGDDSIHGGAGNDLITGLGGANTLAGAGGDDTVSIRTDFSDGADSVDGGSGLDVLRITSNQGTGSELLVVDADMALADLGRAVNFEAIDYRGAETGSAEDRILGGDLADTLVGGGGNDILAGGAGRNILSGGNGIDILVSTGVDTIDGGGSSDMLAIIAADFLGQQTTSWVFQFKGGIEQDLPNGGIVRNVEHLRLIGSMVNDTVSGANFTDTIDGDAGNDDLNGLGGGDSLVGGAGADTIRFEGGAGDTMDGGLGTDMLVLDLSSVAQNQALMQGWAGSGIETFLWTDTAGGVLSFVNFDRIVIKSGAGNDILEGSDAAAPTGILPNVRTFGDRLSGGDGNDLIDGRLGRDFIAGGDGADTLIWSPGDALDGGAGNDDLLWIDAGRGAPRIIRMVAQNRMPVGEMDLPGETRFADGTSITNVEHLRYIGTGSTKSVTIGSGIFEDTLVGSQYADSLAGNSGSDSILGAQGSDSISAGNGNDTASGGTGQDRILGEAGNDLLTAGGGGISSLPGGGASGIDVLADTLSGGDGADTLVADSAAVVDGGTGIDTLVLNRIASFAATSLDMRDAAAIVALGDGGSVTGVEVLNFTGGSGGDSIAVRGALRHLLNGGFGAADSLLIDLTDAGALRAAAGAVTRGADQVIRFGLGRASSFEQVTVLFAGAGDLLSPGAGALTAWIADGGAGADTLFGEGLGDSLVGGAGNDRVDGNDGNDTLDGFIGLDVLRGGAGNDVLVAAGMEAGELYDAGAGADTLSFAGDAVGIRVDMGAATATRGTQTANARFFEAVQGGDGADTLNGTSGAQTLNGGNGNDSIFGSSGDDRLIGNAGADTLDGGTGADTMLGGDGDDTFLVDHAFDAVVEAAGRGRDRVLATVSFTLDADVEELQLIGTARDGTGNAQDNRLTGNALDNLLNGRAGADLMRGGEGADTLFGGAGADTLRGDGGIDGFVVGEDGALDRVLDFTEQDRLLLSIEALDPDGTLGLAIGTLATGRFGYGGGAGPGLPGWRIAMRENILVFDADGIAASGDERGLAIIVGALPVASEILLIG
jgi:Ca2+-binding RTX toxin-like protein